MPIFLFRVDSSKEIGIGHLVRCINFAYYLIKKKYEVIFIVRNLPGNSNYLINNNIKKIILNYRNTKINKNKWLGVNSIKESNDTISILKKYNNIYLILDHYGIDHKLQYLFSKYCKKIISINDIQNRKFYSDIVIDPNLDYLPTKIQNYKNKEIKILNSIRYNFISYKNKNLRKKSLICKSKKIKNILIYFGGSDKKNLTKKILSNLNKKKYRISLIIHKNYHDYYEIKSKFSSNNNIKIIDKFINISNLMVNTDLMICSSGSVNWLRCFMGVPALVFLTAKNQIKIFNTLKKIGACLPVNQNDIKNINSLILKKNTFFYKMSLACRNIIKETGEKHILQDILGEK